ncbi:MAG: hypothetical protein GVY26_10945, partial [Bacteroidetes bacterium]|nr:hypothetical protein [Bacteroidota bacterium]
MKKATTLEQAYDPEHFRSVGHQLVDQLADHLASVQQRDGRAIPYTPPEDERRH